MSMRSIFLACFASMAALAAPAHGDALQDPAAEARLMLGDGEWDRALPLYDRAIAECSGANACAALVLERNRMLVDYRLLELARSRIGDGTGLARSSVIDPQIADALILVTAEWQWLVGEFDEAETTLRERLLARASGDSELALAILAQVLRARGATDDSDRICQRLLSAAPSSRADLRERARSLSNCQASYRSGDAVSLAIGQLESLQGRIADAAVNYDGSEPGENGYDPVAGAMSFSLAKLYRRAGYYERALEIHLALVETREDVLFDRNTLTGESYLDIALLYVALGDLDEAGHYFTNHILEPQLAGLPPDSLALADTLMQLAAFEASDEGSGDDVARAYVRRAAAIATSRLERQVAFSPEAADALHRARPYFTAQIRLAYDLAIRSQCAETPCNRKTR